MNPEEFQELAKNLINKNGPTKAECRTAVNRSYYAVYNLGRNILEGMGFHTKESGVGHTEVKNHLNNCNDNEIVQVANKMTNLYYMREKADYRLNKTDIENPKTIITFVKQTDEMIAVLNTRCFGETRDDIKSAIADYRIKVNIDRPFPHK